MVRRTPWIERRFASDLSLTMFPNVLERLRGTPARVEDRVRDLSDRQRRERAGQAWSIQETVGHLVEVEALWMARIEDFVRRRQTLKAADMSNRRTHDADYNAARMGTILADFRRTRASLVRRLEQLSDEDLAHRAIHPRLRQPMRVLDLMVFAAEHDDHHLATISERLREHPTTR
jgi:uncharacterized damage-inducible protein DinB